MSCRRSRRRSCRRNKKRFLTPAVIFRKVISQAMREQVKFRSLPKSATAPAIIISKTVLLPPLPDSLRRLPQALNNSSALLRLSQFSLHAAAETFRAADGALVPAAHGLGAGWRPCWVRCWAGSLGSVGFGWMAATRANRSPNGSRASAPNWWSRSANAPTPPWASKGCHAGGSASAPSAGACVTGGWSATPKTPKPVPPPGFLSRGYAASSADWPNSSARMNFQTYS